jgi:hypothetical protein
LAASLDRFAVYVVLTLSALSDELLFLRRYAVPSGASRSMTRSPRYVWTMLTATVELVDGARPQPAMVIELVTAAPLSGIETSVPLVPVQLPVLPPVTVRLYVAVRVADAPVPVTVIVYVPEGVDADVASVRVDEPPDVTDVGLNVAVTPDGRPLAEKATDWADPAVVAVLTVVVAELPAATEPEVGEVATEKSLVGGVVVLAT